mmetsp:Transcript_72269/g.139754  ORF Transcript_72269/g.139754 Transcript_72269/m.139754 type:complete len:597 (-) Transcript_72269:112-1902(-)
MFVTVLCLQVLAAQSSVNFTTSAATKLQNALFGTAAMSGWLGGDHVSSFRINDGRYVWTFGDSLSNLTDDAIKVGPEATEGATCNFFPARSCAMPTNTFAVWQSSSAGLRFNTKFDARTGRPTSIVWPPDWGGSGQKPKVPSCDSCSLWVPPTILGQKDASCVANGGQGVLLDKGSCCATKSSGCPGYCCHDELYFSEMTGTANSNGDRLLLLARLSKFSNVMPDKGKTFGTFAISVSNTRSSNSPADWDYRSSSMPGTTVWPWSQGHPPPQFFTAVSHAHAQSQPDLLYLLGTMGPYRVLARANMTNLLNFDWSRVEFWSKGLFWKPYGKEPLENGSIPSLAPLWKFHSSEASLHYDARISKWLVPEVSDKVIVFRVASVITGPYRMMLVGRVPEDVVGSDLSHWDVNSVKNHPELASEECHWVLSMVFHWKPTYMMPPVPGVHHFPRLLCVKADELHAMGKGVSTLEQRGASVCTGDFVKRVQSNVVCSDGDGCHSCHARAAFIATRKGKSLEEAYDNVAERYPQGCGQLAQCKAEVVRSLAAGQAWGMQDTVVDKEPSGTGEASAHWLLVPGLVIFALIPIALVLASTRWRRR